MERALALAALLLLAACSGGGGGSNSSTQQPAAPPAADGIWNGTVTQNGTVINDISCLVTVNDELGCFLTDPSNGKLAGAISGNLVVSSGGQLSGSGTAYTTYGYAFANNATVSSFSITSGTVKAATSINMTATLANQTYSVSTTFDAAAYNRASSLSTVAASYSSFSVDGVAASFSIDSSGNLSSQASNGCTANGTVSVISPSTNGYKVSMTVSNCPGLNGNYTGLATTGDLNSTNDVFYFGVVNGQQGIAGAAVK